MLARRTAMLVCIAGVVAILPLGRAEGASRHYDLGDRLSAMPLVSTDGSTQILTFERPTIVTLWATWSPASLTALSELLKGAPQGGVRWQIVPINVDAPLLHASDTSRVNAAARAAGWNGDILYDRGYTVMDLWGVIAVPTVIFTGLGGAIDELEHDWSPILRDRLFTMYFGVVADSFPGITTPTASSDCLDAAATARRLWRMGRTTGAKTLMQRTVDSCAGIPTDVARLANWIRALGDSVKAREHIVNMLQRANQNAWTLCAEAALEKRYGNLEPTVKLCEDALRQDSVFFPALILLAESRWDTGDTSLSVAAYDRARSINRMDARVLSLGARMAQARGDRAEAARILQAAVEARLRQQGH